MNKKVVFTALLIIFVFQFVLCGNIVDGKIVENKHLSDILEDTTENEEVAKIVIKNRYGNYNITINDALEKDLLMLNLMLMTS